ncbi:MAG: 23S rRNA (uracil(1939)-C(5))-methyltransferase RlmD [Halanaerobiales bacterium]
MKKGDILELELIDIANGGDCVARYQGMAVFVAGGIPGEKVSVRITEKKKSYARAELLEIIKTVEERVDPECAVFGACGGCQLMHIDYQKQLKFKQKMLKDLLERMAKLERVEVQEVIGSEYPFSYRNKAQFPLTTDAKAQIVTGFYKQGTHQVVVHHNCGIQHPLINRTVSTTLEILNDYNLTVYNEALHKGILRHLVVRVGICTNQVLLTIVTLEKQLPFADEISKRICKEIPEVVGVLQNINPEKTNVIMGSKDRLLSGKDYYIDYIGKIKYAISSRSFFQVNTLQTKKLYEQIVKFLALEGDETVLDAYCGIGSISLYIAGNTGKVIGIEEVPEAIIDAEKNAEINGIDNCTFMTGKVEDELPLLIEEGIRPDLIVFDPPRKGLDQQVIDTTITAKPRRIIYVSCNPATLARDLKMFKEYYQVQKVQAVDMFPQTYHVESVVLLESK